MSKSSIQVWSKAISSHEDDLDLEDVEQGTGSGARWDGTKDGWKNYLNAIRSALLSSSTKLRVNVLERELIKLVNEQGEFLTSSFDKL